MGRAENNYKKKTVANMRPSELEIMSQISRGHREENFKKKMSFFTAPKKEA